MMKQIKNIAPVTANMISGDCASGFFAQKQIVKTITSPVNAETKTAEFSTLIAPFEFFARDQANINKISKQ